MVMRLPQPELSTLLLLVPELGPVPELEPVLERVLVLELEPVLVQHN
jgi:hypothetical protein